MDWIIGSLAYILFIVFFLRFVHFVSEIDKDIERTQESSQFENKKAGIN